MSRITNMQSQLAQSLFASGTLASNQILQQTKNSAQLDVRDRLNPKNGMMDVQGMAEAIKKAKNESVNFNGTITDYSEYAKKLALTGELNLDKQPYRKVVKTSDGNTYNAEISLVKNGILYKLSLVDSKFNKFEYKINSSVVPADEDSVANAKERLLELKSKYGEI